MPEIKPIHKIFAALIAAEPPRKTMEDVPEQDREGVQYVLDTVYSN
ncbi:hypothetical protein MKY29_11910 [Psychrobacillus sp. FSL K6-2365]